MNVGTPFCLHIHPGLQTIALLTLCWGGEQLTSSGSERTERKQDHPQKLQQNWELKNNFTSGGGPSTSSTLELLAGAEEDNLS